MRPVKYNIRDPFWGNCLIKYFAIASYTYIIKNVHVSKNAAKRIISSLKDLVFNCSLSALKLFPLMIITCRLRLNHVGKYQYIERIAIAAIATRKFILVKYKREKKNINIAPVVPEAKITLRSLLKNFIIKFLLNLVYNIILSIAHKLKKVLQILLWSIIFYANLAQADNGCLMAIIKYERLYHIPKGLLKAVSKVESEYNPLALNDGLKSHNFKTKQEVIDRISYLVDIGKTNFDIGCMQINYYWHGKNFTSIEEMLDVTENVRYAASLIHGLYKEHGTWQAAVRHYRSYEPSIHKKYSKKVAYAWLKEGT